MLLNEVVEKVGMTKRAIKYYEEKGLLEVPKDQNGYRNYSEQDVECLKKISVYRKLGICIQDIQKLLQNEHTDLLWDIYYEKENTVSESQEELKALKEFIETGNVDGIHERLDYETVERAIECLFPGKWCDYFKSHFRPFLNVKLITEEQRIALKNLVEYCDTTIIKVPMFMRLGIRLVGGIRKENRTAEEMISYYRDMNEADYEALKQNVYKGAKMKSGIMKYHPAFLLQRKMQKELQNKGYNDIFIPNMRKLSPTYDAYKQALDDINDRICRELGLHYDTNYHLVFTKNDKK